jgi:hypothetical protein
MKDAERRLEGRVTRRVAVIVGVLLLAWGDVPEAGTMRMVVADLPYARVWDAALRALSDYPVERTADGVIETAWTERVPRDGEAGFQRILDRVRVRVERFAERVTRVTVEVEAKGWRDGQWVPIADTRAREQAILDRIREAES